MTFEHLKSLFDGNMKKIDYFIDLNNLYFSARRADIIEALLFNNSMILIQMDFIVKGIQ
jgi:hypothetical protein